MKSLQKFFIGAAAGTLLLSFISCSQMDNFNGRWIAGTQDYSIQFNSSKKTIALTQGDQTSNGTYEITKWNSMLVTLDHYEYMGQDETSTWADRTDTFMFDMKKDADGNLIIANFADTRLYFTAETPSKEYDGVYKFTDEYEELTLTLNKAEGTFSFVEKLTEAMMQGAAEGMVPQITGDGTIQVISGKYRTEEEELLSMYTSFNGMEITQDLDYSFSDDKKMVTIGGVNFFKDDGKTPKATVTSPDAEGPQFDEAYLQELLQQSAETNGDADTSTADTVEVIPEE